MDLGPDLRYLRQFSLCLPELARLAANRVYGKLGQPGNPEGSPEGSPGHVTIDTQGERVLAVVTERVLIRPSGGRVICRTGTIVHGIPHTGQANRRPEGTRA